MSSLAGQPHGLPIVRLGDLTLFLKPHRHLAEAQADW